MKKPILFIIILLTIASCKKAKDYAEFSIKLDNLKPADTVLMARGFGINKTIKLKDGVFHDTLKLKKGSFVTMILNRQANIQLFFNNNDNLTVTGDIDNLEETLSFSGNGSKNNNYLKTRTNEVISFNKLLNDSYSKDSTGFANDIESFKTKISSLLNDNGSLDTALVSLEKKGLDEYVNMLKISYPQRHAYAQKFGKGKPSPTFDNLRNYNGGTSSLSDFKGQFVYIDLWATWCNPCLAQISALKELEEEYKGQNIVFVSISTDKEEHIDKWKTMVKDQALGGVQLFTGNDSRFPIAYEVRNIPRFILIDPMGNIVNANAPRPSMKDDIHKLFKEAGVSLEDVDL